MRNVQQGLPWPPEDAEPSYPAGTVQQEIDNWLKAHEFGKGSHDTYKSRRSQLKSFREWCEPRGIVRVQDISRDVVMRYLRESEQGGYAISSLRTRAQALRVWFAWMVDEGVLREAPKFSTPTPEDALVETLTPAQVDLVVKACEDGTAMGFRDRALILFLYATGARASEASKLDLEQLDLDRGRAAVHGKGKRERMVWITPPAVEALRTYIERWRMPCAIAKHARAVFVSSVGRRLRRGVIFYAVRKRGDQAGIPGVYPHLFRHTLATQLLERGADLRAVQEVLGHRRITSTQRYTHLSTEAIRRTVERFHPHAAPPGDASRGG